MDDEDAPKWPLKLTFMGQGGVCEHKLHDVVEALGTRVGTTVDVEDMGTVLVIVPPDLTPEKRTALACALLRISIKFIDELVDGLFEEDDNDESEV